MNDRQLHIDANTLPQPRIHEGRRRECVFKNEYKQMITFIHSPSYLMRDCERLWVRLSHTHTHTQRNIYRAGPHITSTHSMHTHIFVLRLCRIHCWFQNWLRQCEPKKVLCSINIFNESLSCLAEDGKHSDNGHTKHPNWMEQGKW